MSTQQVDKRTKALLVRMTDTEHELLRKAAFLEKKTSSEIMRAATAEKLNILKNMLAAGDVVLS